MCCGVWVFYILADKDIYQSSSSPSDLDFGCFAFCFHSIPITVSLNLHPLLAVTLKG